MRYYEDISFVVATHAPRCAAWVDRVFPDYYGLNFAAAGRIRWRTPAGRFLQLPAPLAWWVWPRQRFAYGAVPGETWDHYYVVFRGPRADRMYREGLAGRQLQHCYMPVANPVLFRQRFDALVDLLHQSAPSVGQATNLLEALFLQTHETGPASPQASRLQHLLARILAHPQQAWDFGAEARRLACSPVHFRRSFKRLAGLAPHQFLIRARMDWAGRLLRQTDLAVKEVAHQSGYDDIYHFTKTFTRHAGHPPTVYRKHIQVFRANP